MSCAAAPQMPATAQQVSQAKLVCCVWVVSACVRRGLASVYNRVCWLRVCDGRGGQLKGRFNALAAGGMFVDNSPGCVGLVSVMRLVKH